MFKKIWSWFKRKRLFSKSRALEPTKPTIKLIAPRSLCKRPHSIIEYQIVSSLSHRHPGFVNRFIIRGNGKDLLTFKLESEDVRLMIQLFKESPLIRVSSDRSKLFIRTIIK